MPDVLMHHTDDGGEITVEAGTVLLEDGIKTAVYLSLFGGEERDRGTSATDALQWWGNRGESDPSRRHRSETQALLSSAPITTATARAVTEAAKRDLAWLKPAGIAKSISANVTIPARNTIVLRVEVELDGRILSFTFTETRA